MRFVTVLVSKWTKHLNLSCVHKILPHLWDYAHGEVWASRWYKQVFMAKEREIWKSSYAVSVPHFERAWDTQITWEVLDYTRRRQNKQDFSSQLLCVCSIKLNFIYPYQFNQLEFLSLSFADYINCVWNFPRLPDYYYNWWAVLFGCCSASTTIVEPPSVIYFWQC